MVAPTSISDRSEPDRRGRLRWYQYRLRTLLLLPVLVSLLCYWYVQNRKAASAQADYESVSARYETGMARARDVCDASARLCDAQKKVPFTSGYRAMATHLARLVNLELRVKNIIPVTMYASEQGREDAYAEAEYIEQQRRQVQDALLIR